MTHEHLVLRGPERRAGIGRKRCSGEARAVSKCEVTIGIAKSLRCDGFIPRGSQVLLKTQLVGLRMRFQFGAAGFQVHSSPRYPRFHRLFLANIDQFGVHVSLGKNLGLTFHEILRCLIGIFIMVYYNPRRSG